MAAMLPATTQERVLKTAAFLPVIISGVSAQRYGLKDMDWNACLACGPGSIAAKT
jgi:hypothetical protein